MTRRLPPTLAMVVAAVALLVAAGLAQSAGGAGEARKGGTLRLATFDEAGVSLDTGLAYGNWAWVPIHATCAKLFTLDATGAEGVRVVREVVDNWDVSRDGRTYTFALKQSFRFHTGAPVTARSFADALDDFGRYLAAGITACVTLYALVNAGVTLGLLPTTGLPMPFVSYGGSSMLVSSMAIGVLLNISSQTDLHPRLTGAPVGVST